MLQRWWFWSLSGVVFAVAAETLNILVPDQHFIQWMLFIVAGIVFLILLAVFFEVI